MSRPIVASNFTRKLSPKSTAGSVISDSSAPGSSTSGLLDRDGTDEDEEDGDNGKEEEEVRASVTPRAKDKRSPNETPLSSKKVEDWIHKFQIPSRGSLEVKIMNRMKKLQRPKRLTDNDGDGKGAKREKRARLSLDAWSQKPPLPEGETTDTLKKYLEKRLPSLLKKRDVKAHRDFLEHTYALRRIQILENPCPVREVLESYPSLQQFVHLKGELCRIFGDDEIPQNIQTKFQKTWGPKILKYAKQKKGWSPYLDAMEAALTEEDANPTEIRDQTVLVLINKLLRQKGKGSQQEVFTILPRTASVDEDLTIYVQPQIVAIGEGFDLDKLYVVCEGMVLCSIPHQSILDSIVTLLSSFYVFNMVYKDSKAILSFLEQALMGIGRGHTLLSVNTLFNDISDL